MVPKERDRSLQDETGVGAFMSHSLADLFRLHVNYFTVLDVLMIVHFGTTVWYPCNLYCPA